ncbi:hypothetical protein CONLIGDRAFT_718706 [Coniochaeta ligniaria NRRL 30616]|uniref:Uncharacterized protein n=1 Tax=Coniochaeta ligniaria NRRL 30616 TaxID=1408157 RepID=A0A1J7IT79_9PEZI|nr:hypothetical protein CONLIGDRAFT_718706 [Coniochaeta ligniaria NRRL 30616]
MRLRGLKGSGTAFVASTYAHEGSPPTEAESCNPVARRIPTFISTKLRDPFLEHFTAGYETRRKPSHVKKDNTGEEKRAYVGEWAVEGHTMYRGMEGDKGLVVLSMRAVGWAFRCFFSYLLVLGFL